MAQSPNDFISKHRLGIEFLCTVNMQLFFPHSNSTFAMGKKMRLNSLELFCLLHMLHVKDSLIFCIENELSLSTGQFHFRYRCVLIVKFTLKLNGKDWYESCALGIFNSGLWRNVIRWNNEIMWFLCFNCCRRNSTGIIDALVAFIGDGKEIFRNNFSHVVALDN